MRQLTKQRCRDAISSLVLTFQPNHSFISALSNDIEHSLQTSRFSVYLYIYVNDLVPVYLYIYVYINTLERDSLDATTRVLDTMYTLSSWEQ